MNRVSSERWTNERDGSQRCVDATGAIAAVAAPLPIATRNCLAPYSEANRCRDAGVGGDLRYDRDCVGWSTRGSVP